MEGPFECKVATFFPSVYFKSSNRKHFFFLDDIASVKLQTNPPSTSPSHLLLLSPSLSPSHPVLFSPSVKFTPSFSLFFPPSLFFCNSFSLFFSLSLCVSSLPPLNKNNKKKLHSINWPKLKFLFHILPSFKYFP